MGLQKVNILSLTKNPDTSERLSRQSSQGSLRRHKLSPPKGSGAPLTLGCLPTLQLLGTMRDATMVAGQFQPTPEESSIASFLSSLPARDPCSSNPSWVGFAGHWERKRVLFREKMLRPRTGCWCLSRALFTLRPCTAAHFSSKPHILRGPGSPGGGTELADSQPLKKRCDPLSRGSGLWESFWGLYLVWLPRRARPRGSGGPSHPSPVVGGKVTHLGQNLMTQSSSVLVFCARTCPPSGSPS